MKKLAGLSLLVMVATVNAMADDPVSMTITLRNGVVKAYSADEMDSVRYVGGALGTSSGVGLKIYLKDSDQSEDYLYSQIESIDTHVEVNTPTITPEGGNISSVTQVTISSNAGTTIYYTLDGSDPAESTTRLSGPTPVQISVTSSLTVRAVAAIGYTYSAEASATFTMSAIFDNNVNRNSAINGWRTMCNESWRLEFPHMTEGGNNTWTVKSTSDYGITLSLEWDNSMIANRWTCYEMYNNNWDGLVDRTNDFKEDPELPAATRSTLDDYKNSGYSRGHLCPSADRTMSEDQNKQTFFLSNMQPQWQYHNGGQWGTLEDKVRDWADQCDTLYVVKAATISEYVTINGTQQSGLKTNEHCIGKSGRELIVPAYFYMALMKYDKASNTYSAVGIWTYHCKDKDEKQPEQYITIDELEQRTGIDFFCNLPDDIEATTESTYTANDWK